MATPNAQRIELGLFLRQFRERVGMNQDAVEKELGWHVGKCSKLELGSRTMVKAEIDRIIQLYELGPADAELVLRLGNDARKRDSTNHVADWAQSYISIERSATEIRYYDAELIPGFLQTEGYARAVLAASGRDTDQRVNDRMERQKLLTRDNPLHVSVVLGEAALHRKIGGKKVLREQLAHLLAMNKLANVRIRLMPFDAGAHRGLGIGFYFLLLGTSQIKRVYLEGLSGSSYLHEPHDISVYDQIFDQLWAAALDERKSATILRRRITDLE